MEKYPWWTDKQKQLADEVKELTDRLMPMAMEDAWTQTYPWRVVNEFAKRGWYGGLIPKKYGGFHEDWGVTGACIVAEEMGRLGAICNDLIGSSCTGGVSQLLEFGTEEQRQKWFPRVCRGELHSCVCITEPYAGSDTSSIETRCTRDGDYYILNGKKRFISNALAADNYMVYATTAAPGKANRDCITGFIVEKGMPGFSIEKMIDLTGFDGFYNAVLSFHDVRVPVANRVGEEGDGWQIMMGGLNRERLVAAATYMGNMREALRYTTYHMKRRIQFGQPTINLPTNQFKLADMITTYTIARLLTYYAAYQYDLGVDSAAYAAMVKLYNTEEMMRNMILDAMQCMGGDGVTRAYPLERIMRDSKVRELAAGTSDIQRLIIYRRGLRDWEEDLKAPRRVIHKDLGVPFPAAEGELPVYAASEEGVLKTLADNYRVNPGLHMTIDEIKEQVTTSADEIIKFLVSLEEQGLAKIYHGRKRNVEMARATYDGLSKANPPEYYRYIPSWVKDEVF